MPTSPSKKAVFDDPIVDSSVAVIMNETEDSVTQLPVVETSFVSSSTHTQDTVALNRDQAIAITEVRDDRDSINGIKPRDLGRCDVLVGEDSEVEDDSFEDSFDLRDYEDCIRGADSRKEKEVEETTKSSEVTVSIDCAPTEDLEEKAQNVSKEEISHLGKGPSNVGSRISSPIASEFPVFEGGLHELILHEWMLQETRAYEKEMLELSSSPPVVDLSRRPFHGSTTSTAETLESDDHPEIFSSAADDPVEEKETFGEKEPIVVKELSMEKLGEEFEHTQNHSESLVFGPLTKEGMESAISQTPTSVASSPMDNAESEVREGLEKTLSLDDALHDGTSLLSGFGVDWSATDESNRVGDEDAEPDVPQEHTVADNASNNNSHFEEIRKREEMERRDFQLAMLLHLEDEQARLRSLHAQMTANFGFAWPEETSLPIVGNDSSSPPADPVVQHNGRKRALASDETQFDVVKHSHCVMEGDTEKSVLYQEPPTVQGLGMGTQDNETHFERFAWGPLSKGQEEDAEVEVINDSAAQPEATKKKKMTKKATPLTDEQIANLPTREERMRAHLQRMKKPWEQ